MERFTSSDAEVPSTLLLRARHGDREALGGLLQELRPILRRWLRRSTGGDLRAAVEMDDVLQETSLAVCRSIDALRTDDWRAFRAWVLRIAANRLHDAARGRSRRGIEFEPTPSDVEPPGVTRIERVFSRDERRVMLGYLSDLNYEERLVLTLREFLQTSWETTAFLLDRPSEKAVRSFHARARARWGDRVDRDPLPNASS